MRLTNNTIFITGATSGIGRALAEQFHQSGNKVIIAGRRQALLDEVTAANPGMEAVRLDISDPANIEAVAADLITRFPDLNVLINNAGIMPFDDVSRPVDDKTSQSILATNLLGPIRMTSALIEHLKTRPGATVINNTSVLAYVPIASTAVYSASKAALHSYTLSLRFMLRDTSVAVQEIAPPWVDTDLIHRSGDPRAMPLDAFIAETMAKLAGNEPEILVDSIASFRANPGPQEHALIHQFNQHLIDNPIPVGT